MSISHVSDVIYGHSTLTRISHEFMTNAELILIAVHGCRSYLLVIIKYILPFHLTSVVRRARKTLLPHFTCICYHLHFPLSLSRFYARSFQPSCHSCQMRKCITMHRHYKSTFNFWTTKFFKTPISERSTTG